MTQIIAIGRTSIHNATLRVSRAAARAAIRLARNVAWDMNRRASQHDPQARVILPVFAIALVGLFFAGLVLGVS